MNLFTTQIPEVGFEDLHENSPMTLATTFFSTEDGFITGGRVFAAVNPDAGTFGMALWRVISPDSGGSSGLELASATFPSLIGGQWNSIDFDDPVAIEADTMHRIAFTSSLGSYVAIRNFFTSAGLTNAPLSAPQTGTNPLGAGSFGNGAFVTNATGYPNQTFGGGCYLVDPTFTTGEEEIDPALASAFLSFF